MCRTHQLLNFSARNQFLFRPEFGFQSFLSTCSIFPLLPYLLLFIIIIIAFLPTVIVRQHLLEEEPSLRAVWINLKEILSGQNNKDFPTTQQRFPDVTTKISRRRHNKDGKVCVAIFSSRSPSPRPSLGNKKWWSEPGEKLISRGEGLAKCKMLLWKNICLKARWVPTSSWRPFGSAFCSSGILGYIEKMRNMEHKLIQIFCREEEELGIQRPS